MIDLHTHSLFSDGELIPSELVRRAEHKGIKVIAITDHVDSSNLELVIPNILRVCTILNKSRNKIKVYPGVEITHVPPEQIKDVVIKARDLGAKIIAVHGETVVEPVKKGTNREAIKAKVDILAHPGLISESDAKLAKINSVYLEISGRGGHSFSNGHVVNVAKKAGAKLVFNTDSHSPHDLMGKEMAKVCIQGAGVLKKDIDKIFKNSYALVSKV